MPFPRRSREGRRARLLVGAVLLAAYLALYALSNLTAVGQYAENAMIRRDWGRAKAFVGGIFDSPGYVPVDANLPPHGATLPTLVVGVLLAVGIAALRRQWRTAAVIAVAAPGAVIATEVFKDEIGRPTLVVAHDVAASYPSGHAGVAFVVTLALVAAVPRGWLRWCLPVLLGWCTLIAGGVVLVGNHRLSDIVGSALLDCAVFVLVGAVLSPTADRVPLGELWSRRTRWILLGVAVAGILVNSFNPVAPWQVPLIGTATALAVGVLSWTALTVLRTDRRRRAVGSGVEREPARVAVPG